MADIESQPSLPHDDSYRAFADILRCPCSRRADLVANSDRLECCGENCDKVFPVVAGIPILIDEANSVFEVADFVRNAPATPPSLQPAGEGHKAKRRPSFLNPKRIARHLVRKASNTGVDGRYPEGVTQWTALDYIGERVRPSRVLVVGSGSSDYRAPAGMDIIYTDVMFGEKVSIICDGHDLPFADSSFDGIISNAVLEHVADPVRCVEQFHRVLKPGGYVYAETPFMQQVHLRQFDFTRFTFLGHRRLFRRFATIQTGMSLGPATALAWSIRYFMMSFTDNPRRQGMLDSLALVMTYPLKYFDLILRKRRSSYDAAGGFYFFGTKSHTVLTDRELIRLFVGRQ